jgi:hypothetical protein
LQCTSSGNSSAILIVVRSLLGTVVLSGVCRAAILFESTNLHSLMKKKGNITTVCCIYAVTDGMDNGNVVALFFCRWCKDKHVEVKQ